MFHGAGYSDDSLVRLRIGRSPSETCSTLFLRCSAFKFRAEDPPILDSKPVVVVGHGAVQVQLSVGLCPIWTLGLLTRTGSSGNLTGVHYHLGKFSAELVCFLSLLTLQYEWVRYYEFTCYAQHSTRNGVLHLTFGLGVTSESYHRLIMDWSCCLFCRSCFLYQGTGLLH